MANCRLGRQHRNYVAMLAVSAADELAWRGGDFVLPHFTWLLLFSLEVTSSASTFVRELV